MTTLVDIRTKVRRLTGRPSSNQITDAQIDSYINTFYLYDFPEHLKTFSLHTNFRFMTEANVDVYDLNTLNVVLGSQTLPAADVYYQLQPPIYVAGYQSFWSQDNQQFYLQYPKLAQIETTLEGNGGSGPYTFTFPNVPILQNSVTVGVIDSTGATIQLVDNPTNRTTGAWQVINTTTAVTGSINYVSGAGTVTFNNTIPSGNEITVTAVPYEANRPQAALYYDNKITVRPVPDKPYLVEMNVYILPTQLVNTSDTPELRQWFQYLAYGAAKKIFEDSQDPEGVNVIMPEYKK